ncbi:HEPN domain-containing protein [uncultured Ramlibacter sp.]|uniref:HEPN domain-containing protein n=1 Tax=uncultured Ramlibacter sp. TaxID=260755 RepID=UPI0026394A34|nr:HEPN domain-containing protein [uncultured Ramlibacter sp.]
MDATFARIQLLDVGQLELRADFARYLCVLVSGYLDQTIREITGEFVRQRAQPLIADLVVKLTDRTTNLTAAKLRTYLLQIDRTWEGAIDALLVDRAKDALDSVIALRHRIAHGQSADVTIARMLGYYVEIKKLLLAIRAVMGLP